MLQEEKELGIAEKIAILAHQSKSGI